MTEDMNSLKNNDTHELANLSKGRKALRNKCVYKIKQDGNGDLMKNKSHLVVKGFGQKHDVDFDDIFSLVLKMTSIRVVLDLASNLDLEME